MDIEPSTSTMGSSPLKALPAHSASRPCHSPCPPGMHLLPPLPSSSSLTVPGLSGLLTPPMSEPTSPPLTTPRQGPCLGPNCPDQWAVLTQLAHSQGPYLMSLATRLVPLLFQVPPEHSALFLGSLLTWHFLMYGYDPTSSNLASVHC